MSDCRLMLNFNGANGDTDVIDETGRHISITFNGTAQISTTNPKFGTGCLLLDGDSDYLSIPASADWNILADDSDTWTIELWVKHDDHVGIEYYLCQTETVGETYWYLRHQDPGGLLFYALVNGVNIANTVISSEIADTLWHHIAVCKVDGVIGLYKDSQQIGYDAVASGEHTFAAPLEIGRYGGGSLYFDGRIDQVAIWKGNPYGAAPNSGKTDTIDVYRPGGQFPLDDDAANTTIRDASGNGNNATLNGGKDTEDMATFLPVGGALKFDGSVDYGSAGKQAAFDWGSGDGTVFAWIRIAAADKPVGTRDSVVMCGNYSGKHYTLWIGTGGQIYFEVDDDVLEKAVFGNTDICDNEPHLIAGVRNGNQIEIYLDGVSDKTPTDVTGTGSLDDATYGLTIGAGNSAGVGNVYHIAAVLAQVVTLPGQALTAAQLLAIYNDGMNGLETPRAWEFWEMLPEFPTLTVEPEGPGWVEVDVPAVSRSRAESGYAQTQTMFANDLAMWSFRRSLCPSADRDTLRDFYRDNKARLVLWTNTEDGYKYVVRFRSEPRFAGDVGSTPWGISLEIEQAVPGRYS